MSIGGGGWVSDGFELNGSFYLSAVELIQSNPQLFSDGQQPLRRLSDSSSVQSCQSGLVDNVPLTTIAARKFRTNGLLRILFYSNSLEMTKIPFLSSSLQSKTVGGVPSALTTRYTALKD